MNSPSCIGERHIIYFAPSRDALRVFACELEESGHDVTWMPGAVRVSIDELTVTLAHERTPVAVRQRLEHEYANLVLVDVRPLSDGTRFSLRAEESIELLKQLDHREDVEARYGFHRIVALVSDVDGPAVDAFLLQLGAHGVRQVLRDGGAPRDGMPFSVRALVESCRMIQTRRVDKTALCLSGGGITGIYFELGVLKCLSDCLPPGALNRMQMLFGISAGAVVASTLAVGYSVDEFMASLVGHRDTRMPPLNLRLLKIGHLNYRHALSRSKRALQAAVKWLVSIVRRSARRSLDDFFLEYSDFVQPLFRSDAFEEMLRLALEVPGTTNDFRELVSELYIGASDQDARQHVLFGAEMHNHVPISKAAQASLSFAPVFPSVEIEGRYYEDGAVTRTSNFVEAIRREATLVVVIDPFVPYVSKEPGYARSRGLLYHLDQSVRTISYTRFENARNWVLRRYPEVSVFTFLPSNRQRRLLANNPMDHRLFLEVWRSAYLSTLVRLEQLQHRLSGDFKAHGLTFDLAPAQYVGRQLEAKSRPDFEDFYPDLQVEIPKPSFVLNRLPSHGLDSEAPAA